jgi:hypothetical protein
MGTGMLCDRVPIAPGTSLYAMPFFPTGNAINFEYARRVHMKLVLHDADSIVGGLRT